jgi:hemolysin D
MDAGLNTLIAIACFHQLPAEPEQIAHQFGVPGQAFSDSELLRAAKALTLKAKRLKPALPMEQVIRAAKLVGAHEFIVDLPEGYDALHTETKATVLTEITQNRREITALQEELVKARDINQRQILYAPVSGQVQELAVNTEGGVVTEAESLMKIVPDEAFLVVEVFLENKDIGFVEKSMPAEVKIHTFPFTKYGVIEAEVETISDDAIFDEKRGFTYSMLLAMQEKSIAVEGRAVRLMPGMEVTAEIKTGERRLIEYFLAPLMRHGQESLRER